MISRMGIKNKKQKTKNKKRFPNNGMDFLREKFCPFFSQRYGHLKKKINVIFQKLISQTHDRKKIKE